MYVVIRLLKSIFFFFFFLSDCESERVEQLLYAV